jgi:O-antigen/teichoic acid export membrane protein
MDPEQARAVVWPGMRRMLGGSAFILGCRLAGAALTFLTQILLARWMGASEFGVYVIAFSWCLLLATVTALGLPMAAIRFIGMGLAQGRGDYIRGFVDWGSRVTVIASAVVAIAGIALIWQLPLSGGFQPALTMALVALPGLSLLFFNGGVANSCSRLTLGFLPTNVLRPVAFFVLVGLFWWSRGHLDAKVAMLLQLFAIVLVSSGAFVMVRSYIAQQAPAPSGEFHGRIWLRAAIPMLAVTLFSGYVAEINVILAGWFLPADEVARFHVSFRLALIVSFGLFAVDAAIAPDLSRLYAASDHAQVQQLLDRATRVRFLGAVLAVVVFVVAGRSVLAWFGPEFVAGYSLLLILATGQLVLAGVGPVARLLSITGHQDRALVASVSSLLLAGALVALLVPPFGLEGAAVAATVNVTIWAVWMWWLVVRYTGFRPRIL